jgi:DNA-binding response OmpR family regulator
MFSEIKQKILVIGNPMMVRRLSSKIDREQFSMIGYDNPDEAVSLLQNEQFDLVIVDNLVRNADLVCFRTSAMGDIPVTLLLQCKPVDWRNLETLKVDGFLLDSGTNAEFNARLRAYIRRKSMAYVCR